MRVLVLGGTAEASRLASLIAGRRDIQATLSRAGRTLAPAGSPLPTRTGGFGGVDGLAAYIGREAVQVVVDATHPFAAQISANAVAACARRGVPLVALSRPAWSPGPGDRWTIVADLDAAARHLVALPAQDVFLTTGRQGLAAFRPASQHSYLVRTIDPPDPAVLPLQARVILGRGPFTVDDEIATLRSHGIALLVTKNSGGAASSAKLEAARRLAMPVLMIARPALPDRVVLDDPDAVLAWLDAHRPPP